MREKEFQDRVIELAKWERWLAYHVPDSRRVTSPGFPDLVLLKESGSDLVFAELKSEKGRVTPNQKKWLEGLGKVQRIHTHIWRPSDWDEVVEKIGSRTRHTKNLFTGKR